MSLLRDNHIRFLFYGRAEQDLGTFNPDGAAYMEKQFENGQASVYQVRLP
jgi:hypothetical protein